MVVERAVDDKIATTIVRTVLPTLGAATTGRPVAGSTVSKRKPGSRLKKPMSNSFCVWATSMKDALTSRVGNVIRRASLRSEEHTSELQSLRHLVCRLLLEK